MITACTHSETNTNNADTSTAIAVSSAITSSPACCDLRPVLGGLRDGGERVAGAVPGHRGHDAVGQIAGAGDQELRHRRPEQHPGEPRRHPDRRWSPAGRRRWTCGGRPARSRTAARTPAAPPRSPNPWCRRRSTTTPSSPGRCRGSPRPPRTSSTRPRPRRTPPPDTPTGSTRNPPPRLTAPAAAWVAWHNQFNAGPASHCVVTCDAGIGRHVRAGSATPPTSRTGYPAGHRTPPSPAGSSTTTTPSSGIAGFVSPVTIVAIRCTTDFNPGDNAA